MVERSSALGEASAPPAAGKAGVGLAEVAHAGKLVLRASPDPAFLAAVGSVGVALPTEPCTAAAGEAGTALWLGPDEWLIATPAGAEVALAPVLRAALKGHAFALVDVTDSRTTVRLTGRHAREVLAKGCALDFHARAFAAGEVKQSLLAGVDVAVHLVADAPEAGPVFDILVLRSFAEHLWRWLADAGAEYGLGPGG
jgi:sarcosine oxidase subunit gamma